MSMIHLYLIIFINDIDNKLLYLSILVFDLWYYNLDRFGLLADKNILFVSRIKRNSIYYESRTVNGHEMFEMNNELFKDGKGKC